MSYFQDYLNKTDEGFRDFVQLRKSGLSQKDLREDRLKPFDERKLLKDAGDYCKVQKALTAITKEKIVAKKKAVKKKKSSPPALKAKDAGTKAKKSFKQKKKAGAKNKST